MKPIPYTYRLKESGQSMIELLVGIGVIAIVFTSVAFMTTNSIQLSQAAQLRQKALSLAKAGIEQVRLERDTTPWSIFAAADDSSSEDIVDKNITFSRNIMKDVHDTLPRVSVRVEVIWTDFKGQHTVTQETFLTKWNNN